jgi:hypothetical protein
MVNAKIFFIALGYGLFLINSISLPGWPNDDIFASHLVR